MSYNSFMKVIIDLIEDLRTAIDDNKGFSLASMSLREDMKGELLPSWQSDICSFTLDEKERKLFLFLGKEKAVEVRDLLKMLDTLSNKAMMYELCVSYSKANQRIDTSLIGFGESVEDKKYFLFISD